MTRNNWFARNTRGLAWTPITWQGWMLAAALVVVPLLFAGLLGATPSALAAASYGATAAFALSGLLLVGFVKGPAPQWRYAGQDD